jgi:hypothetical protein
MFCGAFYKTDIGDKSVFEFMALPEEEQQKILRTREASKEEY